MRPHPLTDEALRLRNLGKSYKEIETELEINRSTLHYIFKKHGVQPNGKELPKWAQERLDQKADENREWFGKKQPGVTFKTRRKGGLNVLKLHPEMVEENLRKGWAVQERDTRGKGPIAYVTRFPKMMIVTINSGTEKSLEAAEEALEAAAKFVEQDGGKFRMRKVTVSTVNEWIRGGGSPSCEGMIFVEEGARQRYQIRKAKQHAVSVLRRIGYRIGSLRTRERPWEKHS